jgi:glycosyltransferase involved in cell wall biosynthesis
VSGTSPIVSIVVPCYRYGRFVAQAVDSLLAQTLRAIEVIVINDASPDESAAVLRRYDDNDRVRVITHVRNIGHIASYNEGLAQARGAYLGLLSADDVCLASDAIERQVALFERDRRIGMVYSGHAIIRPDGARRDILPGSETGVRAGIDEFRGLMWGNYIPHSGTLVRADVQRALGPYEASLPHTADWDLWLRIATRHHVGYVAAPLYAYRMHGENMRHSSISSRAEAVESLVTLRRAFDALRIGSPAEVAIAQDAVLDHAVLQNAWFDLFTRQRARTLQAVLAAARLRPRVLFRGEVWRLAARLAALMTLGPKALVRLESWRS